MDQDTTFSPGTRFGSYEIVRQVGVGSFGSVYEVLQLPLRKRVALKVLHERLSTHTMATRRFLREAESIARLRHPHIVDVYDMGEAEGVPFIAMEFLEGESLARRIERAAPLSVVQAVDLVLPIVSAVATVHDQGVVHRDLKPDNLFIAHNLGADHPKLLDFGIAKVQDEGGSLTRTSTLLGTPFYMSPEQAHESKHIDARSDQWALGVILYECVTGRRPFTGDALWEICANVIRAPLVPPRALRPDLPDMLEEILVRTLSKSPADRYPDVRALGRALLPFASTRVRLNLQGDFQSSSEAATTTLSDMDEMVTSESPAASSLPPVPPVPAAPVGTITFSSREVPAVSALPVKSRARPGVALGAVIAMVVVLLGSVFVLRARGRTPPPRAQLREESVRVFVTAAPPPAPPVTTQAALMAPEAPAAEPVTAPLAVVSPSRGNARTPRATSPSRRGTNVAPRGTPRAAPMITRPAATTTRPAPRRAPANVRIDNI